MLTTPRLKGCLRSTHQCHSVFFSSVTYEAPAPLMSKRLTTLFAVRLSHCDNAPHASTAPIMLHYRSRIPCPISYAKLLTSCSPHNAHHDLDNVFFQLCQHLTRGSLMRECSFVYAYNSHDLHALFLLSILPAPSQSVNAMVPRARYI